MFDLFEERKQKCKGMFFRGSIESYIGKAGDYNYRERMRPLKTQSCNGCEDCGGLFEALTINMEADILPLIDAIEDGATYKLMLTNFTFDWETGLADGYDMEFRKV